MNNAKKKYWFPAKRYGWGWGIPSSWQGWAVLLAYAAGLALAARGIAPAIHPIRFIAVAMALTAALVAVCWIKGEPPRWRWGGR